MHLQGSNEETLRRVFAFLAEVVCQSRKEETWRECRLRPLILIRVTRYTSHYSTRRAIHLQDGLAEWSKALASGASPQGRGFEPHSCHFLTATEVQARTRKNNRIPTTQAYGKKVWPSCVRRWLKAPVRTGVGSNPTVSSPTTCARNTRTYGCCVGVITKNQETEPTLGQPGPACK